ncbi:Nn.00g046790.m01.CDS01 [Neocucurbitaria sp. VM-36]
MRAIQKSLGQETDFNSDRPRLNVRSNAKVITDYTTVVRILRDSTSYTLPWNEAVRRLGHNRHTLNGNGSRAIKQQKAVRYAVSGPPSSTGAFTQLIDLMTKELIRKNSRKLRDVYDLDVIKHVSELSWTRFAARLLHIPLNNSQGPKATFDDRQLYDRMFSIFRFIYLDREPTKSTVIRQAAHQANKELTKEIKEICEALKYSSLADVLLHRDNKAVTDDFMPDHGTKLIQRLFDGGKTVEEVTSLVALLAADLVVSGSFACSQIMDLLLTEPYYSSHWPSIQKLANDSTPAASEALRVYVLEALRLVPPAAPTLRISDTLSSISDWRYSQAIKRGDILHLDTTTASRDPEKFPDPDAIKLDRPRDLYLPFLDGLHGVLIRDIIITGLVAHLRVFGRLQGLKKAPGEQGRLQKKKENGVVSFLSEAQDEWIPLPTSMKVHFDNLHSLQ